uniref:Uncharacterized protein n=1 Tax=Amazona collaria TaxID=241587 RepID=A0A8B9IUU4_9PSIT
MVWDEGILNSQPWEYQEFRLLHGSLPQLKAMVLRGLCFLLIDELPVHIPKQSITLCEKKAQALQSPSHWLRQEISPIISANPPPIQ